MGHVALRAGRQQARRRQWIKPAYKAKQPGRHPKNNDPSTWATLPDALAPIGPASRTAPWLCLQGSEFSAFDIDKCRDRETGDIAPEAMKIVNRRGELHGIPPRERALRESSATQPV